MNTDVKVVVRYVDGRVLKGTTLNFDPRRPSFILQPLGAGGGDAPVPVRLHDLKAVFFVREFDGNPQYTEAQDFVRPQSGRKLKVQFADGEAVVGVSLTYDDTRDGFFLFPADPGSNNERIYVVRKSVVQVSRV